MTVDSQRPVMADVHFSAAGVSCRADRAAAEIRLGYLAAEAGVRQFLDIGTGLPAPDSTHEVAQSAAAPALVSVIVSS